MKKISGKTILLVDDEQGIREIFALEFEMHGCRVLQAGNGKEAFELVRAEKVDAVLTDIRMPGGNGIELLERVQALGPASPPVFLMTGFADITEHEAKAKGARAVFAKPFPLAEVIQMISSSLAAP